MTYKFKNRLTLFFLVVFIISLFPHCSFSEAGGKKILVIGSYDMQNEWEQDILTGFNNVLGNGNIIAREYLDANASKSVDYYDSFLKVLNLKYMNEGIDSIFLMDDEVVDFIKSHLLDPNAFCYKKPIFFVGVNQLPNFSEEESNYISGILDIENSLDTVEVILNTQSNLKTIYLLTDESQYCRSMEEDISDMSLSDKGVQVKIIRITNINNLKIELENLDKSGAAILLIGTYSNVSSNSKVPSKDIIDYIKSVTDMPIYTTLHSYVRAGAIGGIVNDAVKLGEMGGNLLKKTFIDPNNHKRYFITPSEGTLKIGVFNFNAIREYNINPLKCPSNSIFLYKKPYNLLYPKYIVYFIESIIILILVLIIMLCVLAVKNKKRANAEHLKWIESKQREEIKTEYIIIMSHEFRTPLNIIKSVTDLLIVELNKGNLNKDYILNKLNLIIKNSNRLNRTINHSIDVSKIESGIMSASFKMYNIVEVVEDVTNSMIDYAEEHDIDVIFDTNEEEIYTAIDKKSIDRIMLNLLSNAVKSMNKKGSIYVDCKRCADDVLIMIKDSGMGISTEAQKHIFEKFYQIRNSYSNRGHEGNGLGLFIVRNLVEMHNGRINIESQLGVGTTFTITLPIIVVDEYPDEFEFNDDLNYLAKLEFSDIE